jgi:hypothetical protein
MADQDTALDEVRSWLLTVQEHPVPHLDLDELLRTGRRRQRSTRTIKVLAAAAAAIVAAGGAVAIVGHSSATPQLATNPGATDSATPSTTPSETPSATPTPTDTGAAKPVPPDVPGYSYATPTPAQLGDFDYARTEREMSQLTDIPGVATVSEVAKDGQPQDILLLQYVTDPSGQVWKVGRSPTTDKLMSVPLARGFAGTLPSGAFQLDQVAGVPVYHFNGTRTFYCFGDHGGLTMVSGADAASTDAFVAAYLKAAGLT